MFDDNLYFECGDIEPSLVESNISLIRAMSRIVVSQNKEFLTYNIATIQKIRCTRDFNAILNKKGSMDCQKKSAVIKNNWPHVAGTGSNKV